jgi:catechol 2,3-dioxygenase-like lactoylglutathione lyase family enzyme
MARKTAKAKAPLIAGLDHVFLPVRSFEKSWQFWTEAAGGEIGAMWEGDGHQAGLVRVGGVNVVISQEEQTASQPELGYRIEHGRPVLFFATPDVDKLRRDLVKRGAQILRGPLTTHWGRRALTVRSGELVIAFVEDKKGKKRPS